MKALLILIICAGCVPTPHYLRPRQQPAAIHIPPPPPPLDVTILDQAGLYRWLVKHHTGQASAAEAMLKRLNDAPKSAQNP